MLRTSLLETDVEDMFLRKIDDEDMLDVEDMLLRKLDAEDMYMRN